MGYSHNGYWLRFKVLGEPHLHGEAFQMLAGQVLSQRKEVKLVISPMT